MNSIIALLAFYFIFTSLGIQGDSFSRAQSMVVGGEQIAITQEDALLFQENKIAYQAFDDQKINTFIQSYNEKLSKQDRAAIVNAVNSECKKLNIDPKIVFALMARESGFNPRAVSSTGAIGLGQIKAFNYAALSIKDPYNIEQNACGVVRYLAQLLTKWKNYRQKQLVLALASYKDGYGAIYRAGQKLSDETFNYVKDILRLRQQIS